MQSSRGPSSACPSGAPRCKSTSRFGETAGYLLIFPSSTVDIIVEIITAQPGMLLMALPTTQRLSCLRRVHKFLGVLDSGSSMQHKATEWIVRCIQRALPAYSSKDWDIRRPAIIPCVGNDKTSLSYSGKAYTTAITRNTKCHSMSDVWVFIIYYFEALWD